MYSSIVVGTDFSETAELAVRHAVELAKAFGAKLHVVTAFRPAFATGIATSSLEAMAAGGTEALQEAESAIADEIEANHGRLVERLASEGLDVKAHALAEDAAEALIDVATREKADLVVVGNRGMSGPKRFILGSVSNKVTHHAPCSVLVVHTTD